MNEILEIINHSEHTAELVINAPTIARAYKPGHFVIVRFTDDGQRIPFTIVNADPQRGSINIIIHGGAHLSTVLDTVCQGMQLPTLLGPLGQPAEIDRYGTVICSGDGAGFVPLLPIIRAMKTAGNRVITIISELTAKAACLRGEIDRYSDEIIVLDDESAPTCIESIINREHIDRVVMTGPTEMLKSIAEVTRAHDIPTRCILNMTMVDGVGLCGICRVMVDGQRKLTCIDGPTFDAHKVDFDQLLNRQRHFV